MACLQLSAVNSAPVVYPSIYNLQVGSVETPLPQLLQDKWKAVFMVVLCTRVTP